LVEVFFQITFAYSLRLKLGGLPPESLTSGIGSQAKSRTKNKTAASFFIPHSLDIGPGCCQPLESAEI
jgi:hypothetical protein